MKKFSRNLLILALLFLIFVGLAPRFLRLDEVQKRVTSQISKSLGANLTVEKMEWGWLPLPNLTLTGARITETQYDLFLTQAKLYPHWQLILGETQKIGKIILESPKIHIKKTSFEKGTPAATSGLNLPETVLTVKNGELKVEAIEEYSDIFNTGPLTFTDIGGKLKLMEQKVEVDLQAAAPFSKNISLLGDFSIPEKKYRFALDTRDLKLHKSVKAFLKGSLIPVESTARLSGSVTGVGLEDIEGNLHGTLPCFNVKPQDKEVLLTCGFADLKFLKLGPLMRLDINDLEIKDPQVNLSGHVERRLAPVNTSEKSTVSEPVWTLDLTGSDLNLTSIRQKILTLWPENKTARIVCDVVLGGRAKSAAYRFSGPTADFKNLDAMIIEADVLNADIFVPYADLDLTRASGPIQIKDSILTGKNLKAQLGNSYGRNAELYLELAKHHHGFKLDIDIDADLKDLMPVLAHLVKHDGFQRQLTKFSEVSGRAAGALRLGDNFQKLEPRVVVENMELTARYEPIPEKIVIDSGTLHLEPGKVSWQKTKGHIGRQNIAAASGEVSWQSGPGFLNITEMQAQLDGTSLLAMLKQTDVLPPQISTKLSSLNGLIEVTRGFLRGPAQDPHAWKYELELTSSGLTLESPLLSEPARTEQISATVNNNEVDFQRSTLHFLDQSFDLKGLLKHQHLQNWHGTIEFNGPIENRLTQWIKSKGWFPDSFRPRIPCTLKNFKVGWQGQDVTVSGTILKGVKGGSLPMAKLDYENTPEHFHLNELSFFAPGEQGRLKAEFWRSSPKKIIFSWQGFVNAENIDALFEHSPLTTGTFSGDLEIHYFPDQPVKTRFIGLLKTNALFLKAKDDGEPVIITNLEMTGLGKQLTISSLALDIGSEKINGSGQIMAEKDILQLDLALNSPFLSKQTLTRLSQAIQASKNIIPGQTFPQKETSKASTLDFNGRIGFNFDTFTLDRQTNLPYDGARSVSYVLKDVHGDFQLAPENISRTEIFSANLCGLDFKGSWFSDSNLGEKFQFSTPTDETLRLENVLPCLGVQQNIVEGEFTLQANLMKESNTWYDGNIYLKSSQGRILRLKTLSRIFKIVNITDLFEEQVKSTDKKGFPFSQMTIDTHIEDNNLIVDRAIIRGEGLNLFARGHIDLADYDADLALLVAPFKTFDTIISKVPIIGGPIMGEYGSRVNIPVAIKGPISDPIITPLHPEAVGEALLNIVKDTFLLPYNIILKPIEQSGENTGRNIPKSK
jgi:AsmA-like C-terminal region